MGATCMGNYLLTNAQIAAGGTFTSAPINIQKASALAVHLTSIVGAAPSLTFTYSLSSSADGTFVTPSAPATIGAAIGAADVLDFAPECASYIKIIITNNNGAAVVTPTVILAIQESD